MDFDNLEYLRTGSRRQQDAYSVLIKNKILFRLKEYEPILVGTIPINIDIESSDLDIICYFSNMQGFIEAINNNFRTETNFKIIELQSKETSIIVSNFFIDNFEIEIFGQNIPTKHQFAYRHLLVEQNLLNNHDEKFRQHIIELKRKGYKTEPAFAIALGLIGDPYLELLKFEEHSKTTIDS